MRESKDIKKFRLSPPVLTAVISVLCIITIICATVIIDKHNNSLDDVSSVVTPLIVSDTEMYVPSNVSSMVSVSESSNTASKPHTQSSSFQSKPNFTQQNLSPTDIPSKVCYLTFDDGPSENTLKILDILKKYNVKATFFVIGTGKLDYVKRIVAEGHTVGLHCNNHTYSSVYASSSAYYTDLNAISSKVEKVCGVKSNIVRFPGGTSNTASRKYCPGLMTKLSKEMPQMGYYYFDWNVDSGDASGNNIAVSKIMSNIKGYGTSRKNAVVLMHDTSAKDTTVTALPQIIEYYISAGYYLAPLSQNSEPIRHSPNN